MNHLGIILVFGIDNAKCSSVPFSDFFVVQPMVHFKGGSHEKNGFNKKCSDCVRSNTEFWGWDFSKCQICLGRLSLRPNLEHDSFSRVFQFYSESFFYFASPIWSNSLWNSNKFFWKYSTKHGINFSNPKLPN